MRTAVALATIVFFSSGNLLAQDAPVSPDDALQVIESTRGGRHWVDAETAPPLDPLASLERLQLSPTLKLELFAAEPLVMDPVAVTFDSDGRMFVVEYGDYPIGPEDGGPPLSRVVLIEDTDQDGRADKRTVFADHLNFCHSAMPYRGGLLIGEQTRIVHLLDTDGDDIADVRRVLFDGFTPAHPQMQIGNPRWGIDNWIYCNYGPGKITSSMSPETVVTMPRKDFCFDPQTMQFRADGGWGQFGNTVDRWGNRFYCTNRNPIITTSFSTDVATRNPFHSLSQTSYDVAASGGESRVYPLIDMKSNYLSHAGTHTAACGVTALTGDALGNDSAGRSYQDSVFVCEPIGHLVTRSILGREGATLTAQRAQQSVEFLASTDPWFRPASLATGPDGALYLADMYRLWVEHPKFLPPEIAEKLDWRAGEDRGRVYRIVAREESKSSPYQKPTDTVGLVEMLSDANGWRQFTAQQLIVESKHDGEVPRGLVRQLRQHLSSSDRASGRLHCLWTLSGLDALGGQDVMTALKDPDWHVRAAASRLAADHLDDPAVVSALATGVSDDDPSVRLETVIALGGSETPRATAALARAASTGFGDPLLRDAVMTAAGTRSVALMKACIDNEEFEKSATGDRIVFLRNLAGIAGARGDREELQQFVQTFFSPSDQPRWYQFAAVTGLADGLRRHRGWMGKTSLAQLIQSPPPEFSESLAPLGSWLKQSEAVLSDPDASLESRVAAIGLLGHKPDSESEPIWRDLFQADQPSEIQVAAVRAFSQAASAKRCELLLQCWPQLSPAARPIALDMFLRRGDATKMMLAAMSEKQLSPSLLSIDQRVRLLKNRDEDIREQAAELFGGAVSADRREVAQQYQSALVADALAHRGAKVFQRACANCHRMGEVGHEIGPDLSDARNRSPEALLYDILDPNAKVEPRYAAYTVLTVSGEIYSGLIVSDSGGQVVLKMAENKVVTVPRDEIEQIKANDVSLMPEGIEKDVTPQQMADLLAYLRTRS